jgi:hypothetical protein
MRILLLAQFYPPDIGGEEWHVFNLAEHPRWTGTRSSGGDAAHG